MGRLDRWGDEIDPADDDTTPDHDPRCENGWLEPDEEERPRPCLRCRPWLARKDHR